MIQNRLLALGATWLFCSAQAWAFDDPPKFDPASVERGRQNFASTCGFCHGATAKGGEKGPDLLRSEVVLNDEGGKKIGPVILNGRLDKGMPRFALTEVQIADIANFLHNAIEEAKDRGSYKILNIVTGNAKAGEAYFNGQGKCASCHSVTGDLKGIGAKYDAINLQTKMVLPDMMVTEGGRKVFAISTRVTLPSGEAITGTPIHVDDFTVALREADGTYRSFKRVTPTNPQVEIINKLEPHLEQLRMFSDADIHNLTAYLVTLK